MRIPKSLTYNKQKTIYEVVFPLIYARIKFFCLTNMDEQTIIFSDSESFMDFS